MLFINRKKERKMNMACFSVRSVNFEYRSQKMFLLLFWRVKYNLIEILLNNLNLDQVYIDFKNRFDDIFQFWFGPWLVVIVNGIVDVQYIFNHRNIYDHGDVYFESWYSYLY